MRTLSQSPRLRLATFGALYLAQGLPAGFVFILYVVFLTDQGLGNAAIGSAIGLMSIPSALKIPLALLMDRFGSTRFGRRRPYIVAAELGMGATLLSLLFLDPQRDLRLIGAVLFLHATFTAIQDAATDALAVELLQEGERGKANGVMSASKSAGVALTGGIGALVVKRLGWSSLVIIITILIWLVMALVIAVRERPETDTRGASSARNAFRFAELRRAFGARTSLVGLAVAILTPAGPALIGTVYTRLLRKDLGLSIETIGTLMGVIEPIAGISGALLGGALSDRFGMRKVAASAMAAFGALLVLFGMSPGLWHSFSFLVAISIALPFFAYAASAVLVGFYMRLTNPTVAATQIAIFTAMSSITSAIAVPLGGRIAERHGAAAVFVTAGILELTFLGLLRFCDPRAAEAQFRAA
jgi:PAT family beta-lactamase induction signal transducer AmpG